MDAPDYKKYSLPELLDVKQHIDAERYPERAAALEKEIEIRVGHPEYYVARTSTKPKQRYLITQGPLAGKCYADFWIRLGADFLDGVYMLAVCLPVYFIVDRYLLGISSFVSIFDDAEYFGFADVFLFLMFFFNMTYLVGKYGRSWGRRSVGKAVVGYDGEPIGFLRALGRNLFAGFISSLFYLGFLWIFWDARRQAWHDKVFKTFVVVA